MTGHFPRNTNRAHIIKRNLKNKFEVFVKKKKKIQSLSKRLHLYNKVYMILNDNLHSVSYATAELPLNISNKRLRG